MNEFNEVNGIDEMDDANGENKAGATDEDGTKELRDLALERAHDIRKFEIELTWKRATYVATFQGFLLAGLGLLVASASMNAEELDFFKFIVSIIGVVVSAAWFAINTASKRWQEHWENRIENLESDYSVRYKTQPATQPNPNSRTYSISRTNIALSRFFWMAWSFAATVFAAKIIAPQWGLDQIILDFIESLNMDIYNGFTLVIFIFTVGALFYCRNKLKKPQSKKQQHAVKPCAAFIAKQKKQIKLLVAIFIALLLGILVGWWL